MVITITMTRTRSIACASQADYRELTTEPTDSSLYLELCGWFAAANVPVVSAEVSR